MSFILDALKKSDSERQRQMGPALFEVRSATPRGGLPAWAWALGLLLIVNIVALVWFVTRSRPAAPATPIAMAATVPPIAPVPAAPAPVTPAPVAQAPVLPPPHAAESPPVAEDAGNPADYEEALPERNAPAATAAGDMVPTIEQLPASIGNQLPPLHLDMHVYATRPADRFVLVNMQRLREGDATREGARVERITPTGVVMAFRGTRFQLERE
jgi:general secretion pathway protein B